MLMHDLIHFFRSDKALVNVEECKRFDHHLMTLEFSHYRDVQTFVARVVVNDGEVDKNIGRFTQQRPPN